MIEIDVLGIVMEKVLITCSCITKQKKGPPQHYETIFILQQIFKELIIFCPFGLKDNKRHFFIPQQS
jgi:hypothetical protein